MEHRPVAILSAGEIGRRLALSWANGGFNVNLYDSNPFCRNVSLAFVRHNINSIAAVSGKNSAVIQSFEDIANAINGAWLVIYGAADVDLNQRHTLATIEQFSAKDAIFAVTSNTSAPPGLANNLREQALQRTLNLRYPLAPGSRLVEPLANGYTLPDVLSLVSDRLKVCGLCPVVIHKESTGFVMARIWAAIKREALTVLAEEITTPDQIDKAWNLLMEGSPVGPCLSADAMGLEEVAKFEEHLSGTKSNHNLTALSYLQKNYITNGKLGTKSRRGGLYPHTSTGLDDLSRPFHSPLTPLLFVLNLGTAVEHPSVHTGAVYLASPDGRELQTLVSGQPRPDGIDISLTTGMMYWTCMGTPGENDGLVKACSIAGGDPIDIVPMGAVNTPKQIVVYHLNSKLYFYDREGMKVLRCNFDGSHLEVLVQTGDVGDKSHSLDQTRWYVGICVSPATGKFFWTQKGPSKGNKRRIFCANMTMPLGQMASNRTDIECLFKDLPEPIDLELDEVEQVLWWTDRGDYSTGNSLNKADLKESRSGRKIVARHFHEAIGLRIDWVNLHVYLTDIGGEIYGTDIDGKNKKKIYDVEDAAFSGICLLHV